MMLRHLFLPLIFMLLSVPGAAAQDSLRKDPKGRYVLEHTSYAPGASRAVLYMRMKPFIINDLNASDTRISWDEAGQDSVTTIAYIELGNGPELVNQMVDCRAKLVFREEQVTLYLSEFSYHGKLTGSDTAYGQPLHSMSPISYAAQSYAMTALTETLRQLKDRMDLVAVGRGGEIREQVQPKAQRRR